MFLYLSDVILFYIINVFILFINVELFSRISHCYYVVLTVHLRVPAEAQPPRVLQARVAGGG